MRIEVPCVVSLTWSLSDAQNQPIDALESPVEFFVGGADLLEKVEQALAGHERGDELSLQLEPEQAFGDYKPELVCFEARALFPDVLEPGMAFEGLPAGSTSADMPSDAVYVVTEVYPAHVVLDANHPLAGMALRLHIKVVDVRAASAEERDARSVGTTSPLSLLDLARSPQADGDDLH